MKSLVGFGAKPQENPRRIGRIYPVWRIRLYRRQKELQDVAIKRFGEEKSVPLRCKTCFAAKKGQGMKSLVGFGAKPQEKKKKRPEKGE